MMALREMVIKEVVLGSWFRASFTICMNVQLDVTIYVFILETQQLNMFRAYTRYNILYYSLLYQLLSMQQDYS
jgi:hypothetical protein